MALIPEKTVVYLYVRRPNGDRTVRALNLPENPRVVIEHVYPARCSYCGANDQHRGGCPEVVR